MHKIYAQAGRHDVVKISTTINSGMIARMGSFCSPTPEFHTSLKFFIIRPSPIDSLHIHHHPWSREKAEKITAATSPSSSPSSVRH